MTDRSSRIRTAVTVCVVTAVALVSSVGVASAVHVSNVTVTPENPETGEVVTVTATITNGGDKPFSIEEVGLVGRGYSKNVYADDLGTVAAGDSIEVPLTTTFGSEGVKDLRIRVSGSTVGRNTGGFSVFEYPVSVTVSRNDVGVETSVNSTPANAWVPFEVTVSNSGDSPIRNVRVTVDGVRTKEPSKLLTKLNATESETVELHLMSVFTGERRVTTSVEYTTRHGGVNRITERRRLSFVPLSSNVSLVAELSSEGIEATIINRGNAAVQDVRFGGRHVLPEEIDEVASGSFRMVTLNATGVESTEEVEIYASYELGEETRTETATVRYVPRAGYVKLTGVTVTRERGRLAISGSASNVGVEDADSVVVSVVETPNVKPAEPYKQYFVGSVPTSDFGSFDLYAEVDGNVSRIPVRLSYVSDGKQYQRTVEVEYSLEEYNASRGPGDSDGGGGSGFPTTIVGLIAVGVVGLVVYNWRKSGEDSEGWRDERRAGGGSEEGRAGEVDGAGGDNRLPDEQGR